MNSKFLNETLTTKLKQKSKIYIIYIERKINIYIKVAT